MSTASTLGLDEQLCFALYAATNAVTRAYRPLLDPLGLTYPQYLVMLALWQDGSARSGHIAARLHLAPGALTPLLDRLEASGLLARRRDDTDRRITHVELTPAGVALQAAAARAQHAVVCSTELDSNALAALRDELQALVQRMEPTASADGAPSCRARPSIPATTSGRA